LPASAAALAGALLLAGCTTFFGAHEKHAEVRLAPAPGQSVRGTVSFAERTDGVQVSYSIQGLAPNSDHALHVHESATCSGPANGATSTALFSPGTLHGTPGPRQEGDLGNIHADSNGVATGFVVAATLSLDGVRSILGHTIVVHKLAEDFYAPTETETGPVLACGELRP
jgi:Cu-Zn family superoxide dismutase